MKKLLVTISHPIQHFVPMLNQFNNDKNIELLVVFERFNGLESYFDKEFNKHISWENMELNFPFVILNKNKNKHAIEIIRDFKPTHLMLFGYFESISRIFYLHTFFKLNIKLIYLSDSELLHNRNNFKLSALKIWTFLYLIRFKFILTVGKQNELFYKACGVNSKKLFQYAYPIDFKIIDSFYSDMKSNSSSNIFKIAMVGKLVPWKNQIEAIKALKKLDKSGYSIELNFFGSGQDYNYLVSESDDLKNSKIVFHGFIQPIEVFKLISNMNLYIHCSIKEPHSVAISEAIRLGLPLVISDKCGSYGIGDDLEEGENGFVYESGNENDLALKIKSLIDDKDLCQKFSERSRSISLERQSRIINQIEKILYGK